ncbi:hypothetical protein [Desulfobacter vibrioformis]|uniref:hypothetical protein n=1 Tax=Desulfobacter vibrioformis TaxID=34031 RepID=UPI0012EB51C3|nr:hypothetical protein [Desulfobacter vibrioformis]
METITIVAEATLFNDVVFDEEIEYAITGEHAFDEIRADLVDQINGDLEIEYIAVDTLVADWHAELEIYDENRVLVGDGRIYAWGMP